MTLHNFQSSEEHLVSVIVPIFEVENYCENCLSSILQQTYRNIEVICVNDATMDNSITIIKKVMATDHRVKLIHNDVNRGLGGARNAGIAHAKGEYIYFVDSDDWIEPDTISTLVQLIQDSGSEWSMIAPVIEEQVKIFQAPFISYEARAKALMGVVDYSDNSKFITDVYPSAWLSMRTKSLIDRIGAEFPENRLYEDHQFHYACGFATQKLAYSDRHLYHYRSNRDGQITRDSSLRNLEIFDVIDNLKIIFGKNLSKIDFNCVYKKIIVRLTLERAHVIEKGSLVESKFYDKANLYLKDFSDQEIIDVRPYWADEEWVKYILERMHSTHSAYNVYLLNKKIVNKIKVRINKIIPSSLKRLLGYRRSRISNEVNELLQPELDNLKRMIDLGNKKIDIINDKLKSDCKQKIHEY
ncbi:glycosyltransferase family 2 protein [Pseudochrobactrum kiredjianiae]|uniref:Glycosyltransferase family 2 protein n=1 Tax=Pseudochrobactrum kiredjianiae TaxID=386305 RepID=A0ABW3V164_9HYPH|nr:glycosyltransferase family 2 protein [Pseudochrobactrum kiredjianiae]MDM7851880.1 glycosyltransferase family 2 protein [Pseudochrobactrum kiredjianiae]